MYRARQSKFDKFYIDQSAQIMKSIKSMEHIDQNNYNAPFSDLSILFLGPSGSSKSLLVKSICKSMSISQGLNVQIIQTQGLILSKTQLTKAQTYKVGNKEYRQRRAINLYEFHERISLNSLNCFSKLFDLMQQASQALCSCKSGGSERKSGVLPIQSVVLVVDVGKQLEQEELECMRQILNDLKQREIQPILALCSRESKEQISEEERMERIEQEIKSVHQLFSIQRENVYAIELNQGESMQSQQYNYYILRLLQASLREATQFSLKCNNESKSIVKRKKQAAWTSLFFPCWS